VWGVLIAWVLNFERTNCHIRVSFYKERGKETAAPRANVVVDAKTRKRH
jgi:hypothetical protein